MGFPTFEPKRGRLKVNPTLDWTREQAAAYVSGNNIPINALHAKGFPSIGCAPCTRAVQDGESERAGRWWWETGGTREGGLHVTEDGRLARRETR